MSNKIQQEVNKIEIPRELHERSKMGILNAKSEMGKKRKRGWTLLVASAMVAALVLILILPNRAIRY